MTNITSDKKVVQYPDSKVFGFITNLGNFEKILPEDRIENFVFTEDTCSFRIKGMTDLGLKISEKKEFDLIKMDSYGKVPFPFTMIIHIKSLSPESSEVYIDFEGDINPFLKMMVEKPLTNFFNMLVSKLAELKLELFP